MDIETKVATKRPHIYSFNIVVTGRCNAKCTYCHYYAKHKRAESNFDISDSLFGTYLNFIKKWAVEMPGVTSYRFSGGDPMVLKDRLFKLADQGYETTGIKPFVLTAGKALNQKWAEKARNSAISHVFVSIENPLNPDPGAPNPFSVVEQIQKNTTRELPIVPGVCVVPNENFKDLYKICEWFFNELGRIPLICEVNYAHYKSPTEHQWRALEEVLPAVIKDFFPKTQLNIFSSVTPEYVYGGHEPYIFDLNLENSHNMTGENYAEKIPGFVHHLETIDYPRLTCSEGTCPWLKNCQNTKWYWQGDANNSRSTKLRDYCRFKRIVSDAYYQALVKPTHTPTMNAIRIRKEFVLHKA